MSDSPREIANAWLSTFAAFASAGDVQSMVSTFLPHGCLRDFLVFSWKNRTLAGHENISAYLSESLASAQITDVRLDERSGLEAEFFPLAPSISGVAAAFAFETSLFHGRGFVRLLPGESSGGWKALTVFTMADDLHGHEEMGHETSVCGEHIWSWEEVKADRHAKIESDPHVIISTYIFAHLIFSLT
jgi:hypothetical protein